MKIYTDGSRHFGGQINRIDKGFIENGHELTNNIIEADLIYSNNKSDTWKNIINFKEQGKIKGKIILNVLDIPEWIFPHYNLDELKIMLQHADHVTCISKFVQNQLLKYLNIKSSVIYNPAKNIFYTEKREYNYKALMVGRLNDPSKRANLAIQSLILANIKSEEVAVVGSENPGFGNYLGIVSDEELNKLYNSVDFVLMTSQGEGLGLPALEATLCGTIPIVCFDLSTFNEFFPKEWGNYPNPYSIAFYLQKLINNPVLLKQEKDKSFKIGKEVYTKINYFYVAKKILDIFEKSFILEK